MRFAQWIDDICWAARAVRARRVRRTMLFHSRQRFDDALRPVVDGDSVIAYPDAMYLFTMDDLRHAIRAAYTSHN